MIGAGQFLKPALAAGFDFYSGVPCSLLTPFINRVLDDDDLTYVAATSEGEAVGIAAGAWLAGRKTVVMCQNSGLGNMVNPLTSLNFPFRIPTLLIVTWRGAPGMADEPQHELMGEITPSLLDVMKIPHSPFPARLEDVAPALAKAQTAMEQTGLPFAFVMSKGDVAEEELAARPREIIPRGRLKDLRNPKGKTPPTRAAALERLLSILPATAAVIATTGKCGRELFTLADRPQHLYQVGSMGCAAASALGVALGVKRTVVALDGDGAALMKLGAMATIGAMAAKNLIHVILDNGTYDSTGGQPTSSANVDFAAVAIACGYALAFSCNDLDGLAKAAAASAGEGLGPCLIHVAISQGSMANLGRPAIKPPQAARRFKEFLASVADLKFRGS